MKAVQVKEALKLEIIEKEKPVVSEDNQVLVKVKMVGICGSDMHIYHGTNPLATLPRIIGHEITGEVEEIGKAVTGLSIGDKVVVEPIESCGKCYACRSGRRNVCSELEVYGVHREGGMQEYLVMPDYLVHKVSNHLDWKESVLVEPFTIGAQANWRGNVQEGDIVLIMGAGPIGLCCLKIAKAKGAVCIITDLSDDRLEFAKSWGADLSINAGKNNVKKEVMAFTNDEGANVVIDAVCIPKTFEDAVDIVSPAGRVVVLGFDTVPSNISQLPITKKEVTIVGSRLQTNQFPEVIKLFNEKSLGIEDMVTHQFSVDEIKEAISLIENSPNEIRKVVIAF
ncbi:zinc-binding alcohol dehydrogenase family protein [Anaerobacillus isosaccharinicus]|uniref:Alcohol dehydrogenase n=1 Tax=Anaerobacillus isosaccharinicus TaxID=1532552 RepID=A0A1S2LKJ6_9BACI|nr:zinc-binding alcohol dehydrogenase family protein [Anaerobacillus isosaccharinicus]MBA5588358.1 zinc-binding alcohol dehydrogenase family protein [Anaerobacillus isosaccharinicus]QOY38208.1 zinc-binding alcohol dehydrogenase family protein [Anaerobacillus isosaccharinicus]